MTSPQKPKAPRDNGKKKTEAGGSGSARTLGALIALGVFGAGAVGYWIYQEHEQTVTRRKAATAYQEGSTANTEIKQAFSRYVSCLMSANGPVPATEAEFQKKLAQGNEGKYASAGQKIKTQCTPEFRKALDALESRLSGVEKIAGAWSSLNETARAFAEQADHYADSLAAHAKLDDANYRMGSAAQAWSESQGKDAAAMRFESFLICALPDTRARTDGNMLFKWAAVNCTQDGKYAQRLRTECLPKLDAPDEHPTDEEYQSLESIRHAKVPKSAVGIARYALLACSERDRREWVAVDARTLVSAFSSVSAQQESFGEAIARLKPAPPQT